MSRGHWTAHDQRWISWILAVRRHVSRARFDGVNAGIVIALFKADGKVELHERPVDFAQLILALVEFHRAHSESARKSMRSSAVWSARLAKARAGNEPVTKRCPNWLKWNDDKRKFVALPKAAAAVNLAFEMRARGSERIAKQLNERKGVWRPETGWHKSYLDTLLKDRTVLGEFQPKTYVVRDDGRRARISNAIRCRDTSSR